MARIKPVPTQPQTYAWKGTSFNKVPAQVVGEELARLEVKPGDYHRAKDVLDIARDPGSPLHGCFTWDDEKAAEEHRLTEARRLLRCISVVITRDKKRLRRPVYIHLSDREGPRYVRAEIVAQDIDLREAAIQEAVRFLRGFRARYEQLRGLHHGVDTLLEVLETLEGEGEV